MKNSGKGLLVFLIGFGVVFSLSLNNFSPEGDISKDFDTPEEKVKDKKVKIIKAAIDIDPDKLNFKSKGNWITAYIELPSEYNVNDIVLEEILLNGLISPEVSPYNIGDNDNNNIPDLMIKFDRSAVKAYFVGVESGEITITGKLVDGIKFEGNNVIELLHF
ncbi:MAG: hypothetical protein ACFE94_17625 [Candidatus Hodarchaeota archaeon]